MIAIGLTVLFAVSGMFAAGVIAVGLRGFPAAFSSVRTQLRQVDEFREVTFRKTDIAVVASAHILRPDFTAARRLPQAGHDLHAAA